MLNPLCSTAWKWEDSFEMQLDGVAHADMDWIYPTRDSVQWCVSNAGCGGSSRALVGSCVLQWGSQVTVW